MRQPVLCASRRTSLSTATSEYRHKLALFGTPPQTTERTFATNVVQDAAEASEEENPTEPLTAATGGAPHVGLVKHGDVYYLQSPEKVHALLDVERYTKRWPLPPEELHPSSVQHPTNDQWRWLLHSRRVPVKSSGASQSSDAPVPASAMRTVLSSLAGTAWLTLPRRSRRCL